jgi:RNA polymerase-binding transcription factor DksA
MSGYLGGDHASINAQCIVDDHIALIRSMKPVGNSLQYCIECGEHIPLARQRVMTGIIRCITCQVEYDKIKVRIKSVTKML